MTIPAILEEIRRLFPPPDPRATMVSPVGHSSLQKCSGLLALLNELDPRDVQRLSESDRAVFKSTVAGIRSTVDLWKAGDRAATLSPGLHTPMDKRPIGVLQSLLTKLVPPSSQAAKGVAAIVERVRPINWGPFSNDAELVLDPHLTVLTGANDAGKSALLRLLMCLDRRTAVAQRDVNIYFQREVADTAWDQLRPVGAEVAMRSQTSDEAANLALGDDLRFRLERQSGGAFTLASSSTLRNGVLVQGVSPSMPDFSVLSLAAIEGIRDAITKGSQNEAEKALLEMAFRTREPFARLLSLGDTLDIEVDEANERASQLLRTALPSGMHFDIRFSATTGAPTQLLISLRDSNGARHPLSWRGSGLGRSLALVSLMRGAMTGGRPALVLMEEPEAGLHADAQRSVRTFLERLSHEAPVQIVYTTHSAAMINPYRAGAVRVVKRVRSHDSRVYSTIESDPTFVGTRETLGVGLLDSLQIGPTTVVTEGATEMACLIPLLSKLHAEGVAGFEDVPYVMGQVPLIDGRGDNYARLAKVVAHLGSTPIVFLDGDKGKHAAQQLEEGTTRVLLQATSEFEDLVPKLSYFLALAESAQDSAITGENFEKWSTSAALPPQMMFSKKVGAWMRSLGHEYRKVEVMRRALESVDVGQVRVDELRELVACVRRSLHGQQLS